MIHAFLWMQCICDYSKKIHDDTGCQEALANKSYDAAENYRRHPTLTTGVHFGLDDGDGFFNPASRAFAALRLAA